jgi:outer membrane protein TolC
MRRDRVNVAREGAAAATAALNLTRLDVEFAAANAYLDLAAARQLVTTAKANVERLQVFANAVHVLVDNQLRAGADAAQADAQLAVARTLFVEAQTNAAVRAAVLSDFLGVSASALDLDDSQLANSAPPDLPDTTAITTHPEARQEAALVNQQQAELSALEHSYAPQFNTEAALSGRGAGTSLSGAFPGGTNGLAPGTMNWAVGVQVSFPAFDIFAIHERKKIQQANVRAEQARYEQTVDDLSAQVQQAEAQLAGARQVAQNTPIELAAARESEVQQRARFQSGLATVVDMAAAESLLVQAETDDAVARLNTWRSLAAVAAARGDLAPFVAQLAK